MKLANQLLFLKGYGEGVLTRIHYAYRIGAYRSDDTKPTNKDYGKIIKKITDAFPGEPKDDLEKIAGYEAFKGKDRAIISELGPIYESIVATIDYRNAVMVVFQDIAANVVSMKLYENPLLLETFMSILQMMPQQYYLIQKLLEVDVKSCVAVFAQASRVTAENTRSDYPHVAQLIADMESFGGGIRSLHSILYTQPPLVDLVTNILRDLCPVYQQIFLENPGKQGLLNPLHSAETVALPLPSEIYMNQMKKDTLMHWIVSSFMLFPSILKEDFAFPLLDLVLPQIYALPMFREQVLEIHPLMDLIFDKFDRKGGINLSKKKYREHLADAAVGSVTHAITSRKTRRHHLCKDLSNLVEIFEDQPGLLGPKAELAICCLSMAKAEVMWYFRHAMTVQPNVRKASKKSQLEFAYDPQIPQLILKISELVELMIKHKAIIQSYYKEYLAGLDLKAMLDFQSLDSCPGAKSLIAEAVEILRSIDLHSSQEVDLEKLRKVIFTIQTVLSVRQNATSSSLKDSWKMLLSIINHSRLVDDWTHIMREYGSSGELFFFSVLLESTLANCLRGEDFEAMCSLSMVKVCGHVLYHLHPNCPSEHPMYGNESVRVAERFMVTIRNSCQNAFREIFDQMLQSDLKSKTSVAVNPYPHNRLASIATELREYRSIQVFTRKFHPKEYLRSMMVDSIRSLIRNCLVPQNSGGLLLRPTDVHSQIQALIRACQYVSSFIELEFEQVIRTELLREVHDPAMSCFGMDAHPEDAMDKRKTMVMLLSEWMLNYILKSDRSIVFAEWKHSFVTVQPDSDFRIERYLDPLEATSLVTLIGAYGVLYLDSRIRLGVYQYVKEIHKILNTHRHDIQSFQSLYTSQREQALGEAKRVASKGLEAILPALVSAGKLLGLRNLLFSKLREVLMERVPFIVDIVDLGVSAYYNSAAKTSELMRMEMMGKTVGSIESDCDALLLQNFIEFNKGEDSRLWALLPTALAMCFTSNFWREARYSALQTAFANNANCIIKSFNMLVATFAAVDKAVIPKNPSGVSDNQTQMIMEFLKISSTLVLTIKTQSEESYANDMIVFLHFLALQSKAVSESTLEDRLPMSLVRSLHQRPLHRLATESEQAGEVVAN